MKTQNLIEINGKWLPCEAEQDGEMKEISIPPQVEIERLKAELLKTDYKAIKYAEGWYTDAEYEPIKTERQALRCEINKLEKKL